jgi:hypothetical protein
MSEYGEQHSGREGGRWPGLWAGGGGGAAVQVPLGTRLTIFLFVNLSLSPDSIVALRTQSRDLSELLLVILVSAGGSFLAVLPDLDREREEKLRDGGNTVVKHPVHTYLLHRPRRGWAADGGRPPQAVLRGSLRRGGEGSRGECPPCPPLSYLSSPTARACGSLPLAPHRAFSTCSFRSWTTGA